MSCCVNSNCDAAETLRLVLCTGRKSFERGQAPAGMTDGGALLARELLNREWDFDQLEVDLTGLPAALLISAFFKGFLMVISAERPELLPKAKRIGLRFDHNPRNLSGF